MVATVLVKNVSLESNRANRTKRETWAPTLKAALNMVSNSEKTREEQTAISNRDLFRRILNSRSRS